MTNKTDQDSARQVGDRLAPPTTPDKDSIKEDRAGGVFIGILIAFGSVVAAAAAATFERDLQNGVDLKSENELTV